MGSLDDLRKKLRDPLSDDWQRIRGAVLPCNICQGHPGPVEMAAYRRRDEVGVAWVMCKEHALQHTLTAPHGVPWGNARSVFTGHTYACVCGETTNRRFRILSGRKKVFHGVSIEVGNVYPMCEKCEGILAANGLRSRRVMAERCACMVPAMARFKLQTSQTIEIYGFEHCDGDEVPLCPECRQTLMTKGVVVTKSADVD